MTLSNIIQPYIRERELLRRLLAEILATQRGSEASVTVSKVVEWARKKRRLYVPRELHANALSQWVMAELVEVIDTQGRLWKLTKVEPRARTRNRRRKYIYRRAAQVSSHERG